MGVYDTLIQSDTLEGYVRGKTVTRSVGVGRLKKPKDLSEIEREECGHGKGMCVYVTLLQ